MIIQKLRPVVESVSKSIWLFPVIATVLLFTLTTLKISGSSIGVYDGLLSPRTSDLNLLAGHPRTIRSDEWVVTTPFAVAQSNDNYARVNHNLGNGEDISLLVDAPYKEWSEVFKPHNWAFFLLPFDYAFAFKWWFMGYAVVLSMYFFVLTILPRRYYLASAISIALFFSALLQWWYQYITLAPIYYGLLIIIAAVSLLKATRFKSKILITLALSYLLVSFFIVLYPPFQIPIAIVVGLYILGQILSRVSSFDLRPIRIHAIFLATACFVAAALIAIFLFARADVIHTINNTAYPGKRVVPSGGYSLIHFFSGSLALQFTGDDRALLYTYRDAANQSEASSFVFLGLFTIPISVTLFALSRPLRKTVFNNLPHILAICGSIILLAWLFVPHLGLVGKLLLLNKVPLNRALIGLGFANFLIIPLFIRQLSDRENAVRSPVAALYGLVVLLFLFYIHFQIMHFYPGFVGHYRIVLFALPIPCALYYLLRGQFRTALTIFTLFVVFLGYGVNPLYKGTAVISKSPILQAVRQTPGAHSGRWITDVSYLENFPLMAGVPTLTGVYGYPQNGLWHGIDQGKTAYIYNRYAHVNFVLNRDTSQNIRTSLIQPSADHFGVMTEACGDFLRTSNVHFILTTVPIYDDCVRLAKQVNVSSTGYYIYRLR